MLVLSRRLKQSIMISDKITVTVVGIDRGKVRLAFDAPAEVQIIRQELYDAGVRRIGADSAKRA